MFCFVLLFCFLFVFVCLFFKSLFVQNYRLYFVIIKHTQRFDLACVMLFHQIYLWCQWRITLPEQLLVMRMLLIWRLCEISLIKFLQYRLYQKLYKSFSGCDLSNTIINLNLYWLVLTNLVHWHAMIVSYQRTESVSEKTLRIRRCQWLAKATSENRRNSGDNIIL